MTQPTDFMSDDRKALTLPFVATAVAPGSCDSIHHTEIVKSLYFTLLKEVSGVPQGPMQ